ncbi:MAG: hypothetical protein DMG76_23345 [Acidobacteria bacterium]|nr:MAG: hypothetical protein DMG76_23345 [Acidobacteriota bacterium]
MADQTVRPTPVRLKLKSFQISTLVLSFSTIAFFEYQSENPSARVPGCQLFSLQGDKSTLANL